VRIVDKNYQDITDKSASPKPGQRVVISDDTWCQYLFGCCTEEDGKLVASNCELYFDEEEGRWEARRRKAF
jgi:hypothetical protein